MPDLRLALPAAALWLSCGLVIGAPSWAAGTGVLAGIGAVALLAAASVARRRAGGLAVVAVMLAAAAVGLAAVAVQAPGRTDPALEHAASAATQMSVSLRVESAPRRVAAGFDGRDRWSVRGTTVAAAQQAGDSEPAAPAGIPLTLIAPADEAALGALALGSTVAATVTLRADEPGEATTFTAFSDTPPARVAAAPPWLAWTGPLRDGFARAAATTPGDGGALLPGLAIGDETGVDASLDTAMKTSSLSHLTAVSGANCALVTGLVFLLAARIGLGRRTRVLVALTALGAFVLLVGPGASVLRAATMAVVVLIGLVHGRLTTGLPTLALAVIVLLLHDPWLSRDYGFALSALATAGLLVLARPLAGVLSRWLPTGLALALAVPVAAQAACQPVLLLLTPTIPLFGIPANLLAEPAAPLATVIGCLACIALPWAPGLGHALVWLAWLPAAWIAQLARFSSGLPGAALPWPEAPHGVLLWLAASIAVAIVLARSRLPRLVAAVAAIGLCAGGGGYLGVLGGNAIARVSAMASDWQIAACDVGQGDALLLRSGGDALMIDVGRHPEPAADCLDRLGIDRLRLLVLTHFDADHVGGLSGVIGRVERALVGEPVRDADARVLEMLEDAQVPHDTGHAGLSGRLGEIGWQLLWPPQEGWPIGTPATGNAGSLTLLADGAGLRSVFLGDLDEDAQDALLTTASLGRADVVKVAHHGSSDQSERLYPSLGARLGLVSVGADNSYGHPTQRALDILSGAGTAVTRTDRSGMLLVSPGPDGPRLWAEHPDTATRAGGHPYPGYGRGGTWPPEHPAEPARADHAPLPSRSRSSGGTASARPRSSWSRGPRGSSPIGRSVGCATFSRRRTRVWRSATSPPPTTRRANCSPSRAPPCSASRG